MLTIRESIMSEWLSDTSGIGIEIASTRDHSHRAWANRTAIRDDENASGIGIETSTEIARCLPSRAHRTLHPEKNINQY